MPNVYCFLYTTKKWDEWIGKNLVKDVISTGYCVNHITPLTSERHWQFLAWGDLMWFWELCLLVCKYAVLTHHAAQKSSLFIASDNCKLQAYGIEEILLIPWRLYKHAPLQKLGKSAAKIPTFKLGGLQDVRTWYNYDVEYSYICIPTTLHLKSSIVSTTHNCTIRHTE